MNLIIFSGFLGSGKTSVILNLARYLVQDGNPDKVDLVIIENEIGDIGIDDKVLKLKGFSVRELFSGCICCQLTADLITTLNDITEKINPEWVILECTGLAYPANIIGTLNKYGSNLDKVITVTIADAERWEELLSVTPFLIENQIKDVQTILINKIDLVNSEKIIEVENHVKKINPTAILYKINAGKEIDSIIWKSILLKISC